MSYTRRYRERIAVHYSGSVRYNYPASQNGGSGTAQYSGVAYEDVNVSIDVDTRPFDNSVEHCNTNVNLLTGAVVATEAAQIASIDKNSKKVANTIVTGFFGYIRSEISQQISEYSKNIDGQLMHLKELAQSCLAKKKQMEGDFLRISSRYFKIFDDLNNELSNRVFELDKPTFNFKKELDKQHIRVSNSDLVNVVAVFGKEGSELHSKISASITKKSALDTLKKAKTFLLQQKNLNNTIQQSMLTENIESTQYVPVCFFESIIDKDQKNKALMLTSFLSPFKEDKVKNNLIQKFSEPSVHWISISKDHVDNLKLHFNSEINKRYVTSESRSLRVRDMIYRLADLNVIETNTY